MIYFSVMHITSIIINILKKKTRGKNKKNRKIQNFTSCDTVFSISDSEGGAGGNGSAFRFRVQ